jgi:RNA polymerase sigma-70 factor, ECF subfamily
MTVRVTVDQSNIREAAETGGRASASDHAAEDRVLASRAALGDVAAFQKLFERYQRPMGSLVARMTANPDDVDDVLQEVFVRAWKGLPSFRGDAQFSTWLYRIAVNTTIKFRSKRKLEQTYRAISTEEVTGGMDQWATPSDAPASVGGDPWRETEKRDAHERLRRAVQTLSEKHRAVVVLHYFEGHSCEEIARILGCSVGTVWSRLHYACKKLKELLPGELS